MSESTFTAEDLYLYSMHLLEPDENRRLEDFLQRSSEARAELLHVRGDLASLALSVEAQAVPETARHRFMNQVLRERRVPIQAIQPAARESQRVSAPSMAVAASAADADRHTPSAETPRLGRIYEDEATRGFLGRLFPWAGWAVAAGLAFTTWTYYKRTVNMDGEIADAKQTSARAVETSARAQTVLETLRSRSSQRFLLTAQGSQRVPSARVTYLAASGSLVFQGNDLESLPTEKTYELWLIPAEKDAKPVPAGTFKPDARGFASLILPALPKGITAGTFGITMEDDGGSQTPTLPILLVGA